MDSDIEFDVPFDAEPQRYPELDEYAEALPPDEDVAAHADSDAYGTGDEDGDETYADDSLGGAVEGGAVDSGALDASSEPYVGRWNKLVSTTNWEKGRIISDWRASLQDSGAPASEYSDEAWARRVGGVTAPHVGRLRRVFERFGGEHESYPGLYWSHFLAALDWDDAPMWLEGAVRSGWSISAMRAERWRANGGDEAEKPSASDIVDADMDEDVVMPAQGGGSEGRYDQDPGEISAGPLPEEPDFGEEPFGEGAGGGSGAQGDEDEDIEHLEGASSGALVQPFAGLPDLPPDMSEALEMFKLSIIRHKASKWRDIAPEAVLQTLDGLKILVQSRSE